jgi:hypothetical protein
MALRVRDLEVECDRFEIVVPIDDDAILAAVLVPALG